jgi:hypothetical protein
VITSDQAIYAYAAAAGVRLRPDLCPPLLFEDTDFEGLKLEIVYPDPGALRSSIHLVQLGSRRDYLI